MKKEAAYFAQFSTPQLEEMLRQGLKRPDNDRDESLLLIMEVLEERNRDTFLVTEEEIDQAWEQFQTYYNIPEGKGVDFYEEDKPFHWEEAPTQEKEAKREKKVVPIRFGSWWRKIPKTARVAVATLFVTFSTITVAQAAGIDFYGIMGTWTNNIFQFRVSENTPTPEQQKDTEKIQTELTAMGVYQDLAPTWWPEGFEMYDITHVPVEGEFDSLACSYENKETNKSFGYSLDVYYNPFWLTTPFEKDDTPIEIYESNGRSFYIMSNIDTLTATWSDGTIVVTIGGQLTRDEIKGIIDSIGG